MPGAIFASLKAQLVGHLLAEPGRAAFIVDEAVTVTEDELGARTLGDLVRRGRHFGLEVHVLTQRVTDWFDSRIGRTIQSVAASKWFDQLQASASEVAREPRTGQRKLICIEGLRFQHIDYRRDWSIAPECIDILGPERMPSGLGECCYAVSDKL